MIYRFGEYELDTGLFELREAGTPQRLEPQVFEVLAFLVENRGRLVTKDELLEKVWGDKYISEAALNSRLMAARRAIGDSGREQRWIRTQYSRGFRFVGSVEEVGLVPTPAVNVEAKDESPSFGVFAMSELLDRVRPETRDSADDPSAYPAAAAPRPQTGLQGSGGGRRSGKSGRRIFITAAALAAVVGLALAGLLLMRDGSGKAALSVTPDCTLPAENVTSTLKAGAITFTSQNEGRSAVYKVNFDGSGLDAVFSDQLFDSDARWSQDGKRMAFTSTAQGNRDIFLTTLGQTPLRLTHDPSDDLEPAWSPDGTLLAFTSSREGQRDIFLITPDGAIRGRVTNDPADDFHPTWSPDGGWIAFASTRNGNRDLFLTRIDGTCLTQLTDHIQDDDQPAWSPNGREIAFQSRRDGNREIYTINVDGNGLSRLTNDTADDRQPTWSPDGNFLAFVSSRDRVRRIYVVQSNGVGLRKLVDALGDQDQPAWLLAP